MTEQSTTIPAEDAENQSVSQTSLSVGKIVRPTMAVRGTRSTPEAPRSNAGKRLEARVPLLAALLMALPALPLGVYWLPVAALMWLLATYPRSEGARGAADALSVPFAIARQLLGCLRPDRLLYIVACAALAVIPAAVLAGGIPLSLERLTGGDAATTTVVMLGLSADLVRFWATIVSFLVLHAAFRNPRVAGLVRGPLRRWPETALTGVAVLAVLVAPVAAGALPNVGPSLGAAEAHVMALAPSGAADAWTSDMSDAAETVTRDVLGCLHANGLARQVRMRSVRPVAAGDVEVDLRLVVARKATRSRGLQAQGAAALLTLDNSLPPWVHTVTLSRIRLDRWEAPHARPVSATRGLALSGAGAGAIYEEELGPKMDSAATMCARPWR